MMLLYILIWIDFSINQMKKIKLLRALYVCAVIETKILQLERGYLWSAATHSILSVPLDGFCGRNCICSSFHVHSAETLLTEASLDSFIVGKYCLFLSIYLRSSHCMYMNVKKCRRSFRLRHVGLLKPSEPTNTTYLEPILIGYGTLEAPWTDFDWYGTLETPWTNFDWYGTLEAPWTNFDWLRYSWSRFMNTTYSKYAI